MVTEVGVSGYGVEFTFTDAGEPGTNDLAQIEITDPNGETVLFVSNTLSLGNHQTHRPVNWIMATVE